MFRWCVVLLALALAPVALAAPPSAQVMNAQVPGWLEPTVAVWHGGQAYVFQGDQVLRYDAVRDAVFFVQQQSAFHRATAGFSDGARIHLLAYEGPSGACHLQSAAGQAGGVRLRLFHYDPATGAIEAGPDVVAARPQVFPYNAVLDGPCAPTEWAPALAWDGQSAWLLGGRECGTPCNVLRFDPATGRLTAMAGALPFLTTRHGGAAVAAGGDVYLFGGMDPSGGGPLSERPSSSVLRYHVATDQVTVLPGMPLALAWTAAAFEGGRICILGGDAASGGVAAPGQPAAVRTILRFDPADGSFEIFHHLPFPVHSTTAAADGASMHLFGGITDSWTPRTEVVRVDCDGAGTAPPVLLPPTTPLPTGWTPRAARAGFGTLGTARDGAPPAGPVGALSDGGDCAQPPCAAQDGDSRLTADAQPWLLSRGEQLDHDCAGEGQLLFGRPCNGSEWLTGHPIREAPAPRLLDDAAAPPAPAATAAAPLPLPTPWLLLAVVAATAGLAFLWRRRRGAPLLLPLFSRVRPDQVASHPVRARILRLVAEQPGLHFTALLNVLGTGRGGLRHHLTVLLGANLLAEESHTGRRHYYLRQVPPEVRRAIAALAHPSARRVLAAARADGPSISEVARDAGLSRRAVRAHLLRLEEAGLVRLHRTEGRTVVLATGAADACA